MPTPAHAPSLGAHAWKAARSVPIASATPSAAARWACARVRGRARVRGWAQGMAHASAQCSPPRPCPLGAAPQTPPHTRGAPATHFCASRAALAAATHQQGCPNTACAPRGSTRAGWASGACGAPRTRTGRARARTRTHQSCVRDRGSVGACAQCVAVRTPWRLAVAGTRCASAHPGLQQVTCYTPARRSTKAPLAPQQPRCTRCTPRGSSRGFFLARLATGCNRLRMRGNRAMLHVPQRQRGMPLLLEPLSCAPRCVEGGRLSRPGMKRITSPSCSSWLLESWCCCCGTRAAWAAASRSRSSGAAMRGQATGSPDSVCWQPFGLTVCAVAVHRPKH